MFLCYETARFRQIAADQGYLQALSYVLIRLIGEIANSLAETASRIECLVGNFTSKKLDHGQGGTLTFKDYLRLKKEDSYYRGRWVYIKEVLRIVKGALPGKVLELGPRRMPIVRGADIMDLCPHGPELKYLHDARMTPWPVGDKAYDLFIALQVWEHLEGRQPEAFREVMRVSRAAVLSFPYRRYCPGNCHHGVDEKTILDWTLGVPPEKVERRGTVIIYFFRF